MIVIPAIDLIAGKCVRLRQGSYADKTVYDEDPVAVAQSFVDDGAERIHIVDLDAARGDGENRSVISKIRSAVACTLELGGGIRSRDALLRVLDIGIDYVVLGTVVVRRPDEVARWAEDFGSRLIASIDARNGIVQVSGWQEDASRDAVDLSTQIASWGFAAIEYTDIGRDGMLSGPDIEGGLSIAKSSGLPTILSGGVATTRDADTVARVGDIAGLIVGRAIYEGTFDLRQAIDRLK